MRWVSHSRLGIWGKTKCCDRDGRREMDTRWLTNPLCSGSIGYIFWRVGIPSLFQLTALQDWFSGRLLRTLISNYPTIQRNGAGPSRGGGRDCQAHILLPIHCNWIDYSLLAGYPHELAHLSKAWGRNGSPFRAANIAEWHPSPPVLSPSPQPVY